MTVRGIARRVVIAVGLGLAAGPALADVIDGDWCSAPEVRHMSIAGEKVVSPGGIQTTGNYSRHAFSYVVPAGDPDAGDAVDMRLLNENEVQVRVNGGQPEIWRRCELNA